MLYQVDRRVKWRWKRSCPGKAHTDLTTRPICRWVIEALPEVSRWITRANCDSDLLISPASRSDRLREGRGETMERFSRSLPARSTKCKRLRSVAPTSGRNLSTRNSEAVKPFSLVFFFHVFLVFALRILVEDQLISVALSLRWDEKEVFQSPGLAVGLRDLSCYASWSTAQALSVKTRCDRLLWSFLKRSFSFQKSSRKSRDLTSLTLN